MNSSSSPSSSSAASSEIVRFGLLGYGLFGTHHARSIDAAAGVELAAVAVKSEASQAAARGAHPTATIFGDYRSLLDDANVDAVSIVLPNRMHYQAARDCLEAGKHVLLEKPMALDVSHCDELIAMARDRKLVLAVGHELRLSSLWGGLKQLIDDGAIGDPQHALIELSRFPYREGAEGWRYDVESVGSWILEEPIHFFDLARWFLDSCGEPSSVYARANGRHPERPELLDNFSCIVNYDCGAYAVISQTLAAFEHHVTAKIAGTKGCAWAFWSAADARSDRPRFGLRYGLGDAITEIQFDKSTGELLELADEVAAVASCIRDGGSPPCTGVDGRWSTLLCLAAKESVDLGKVIQLNKFAER